MPGEPVPGSVTGSDVTCLDVKACAGLNVGNANAFDLNLKCFQFSYVLFTWPEDASAFKPHAPPSASLNP